ncbi:hypothetical protein FLSI110296_04115 [Flavobacterium sinopsychrotolerans]
MNLIVTEAFVEFIFEGKFQLKLSNKEARFKFIRIDYFI